MRRHKRIVWRSALWYRRPGSLAGAIRPVVLRWQLVPFSLLAVLVVSLCGGWSALPSGLWSASALLGGPARTLAERQALAARELRLRMTWRADVDVDAGVAAVRSVQRPAAPLATAATPGGSAMPAAAWNACAPELGHRRCSACALDTEDIEVIRHEPRSVRAAPIKPARTAVLHSVSGALGERGPRGTGGDGAAGAAMACRRAARQPVSLVVPDAQRVPDLEDAWQQQRASACFRALYAFSLPVADALAGASGRLTDATGAVVYHNISLHQFFHYAFVPAAEGTAPSPPYSVERVAQEASHGATADFWIKAQTAPGDDPGQMAHMYRGVFTPTAHALRLDRGGALYAIWDERLRRLVSRARAQSTPLHEYLFRDACRFKAYGMYMRWLSDWQSVVTAASASDASGRQTGAPLRLAVVVPFGSSQRRRLLRSMARWSEPQFDPCRLAESAGIAPGLLTNSDASAGSASPVSAPMSALQSPMYEATLVLMQADTADELQRSRIELLPDVSALEAVRRCFAGGTQFRGIELPSSERSNYQLGPGTMFMAMMALNEAQPPQQQPATAAAPAFDYAFQMEPDVVPVRPLWLDAVALQARDDPNPFWVKGSIGIYSDNHDCIGGCWLARNATQRAARALDAEAAHSVRWRARAAAPPFALAPLGPRILHINGNALYALRDPEFARFVERAATAYDRDGAEAVGAPALYERKDRMRCRRGDRAEPWVCHGSYDTTLAEYAFSEASRAAQLRSRYVMSPFILNSFELDALPVVEIPRATYLVHKVERALQHVCPRRWFRNAIREPYASSTLWRALCTHYWRE